MTREVKDNQLVAFLGVLRNESFRLSKCLLRPCFDDTVGATLELMEVRLHISRQSWILSYRPLLSLTELNRNIKQALRDALPETYWVRAETSEVRVNSYSGHCYLEFIEKDERTGQVAARARGTIWAQQYAVIRPYFEEETGRPFTSGLKVLVRVAVDFHELYGLSLTVHDIDPSFTVGDLVRRRKEIIRQLQADGVFDLNRSLSLPPRPQRIAVISSATAAGYEDFTDQLLGNEYGFPFYVRLYPALMQGERTEASIIAALLLSSLWMAAAYTLAGAVLYASLPAALASAPGLLMEGIVNSIIAFFLLPLLRERFPRF